MEGLGGGVAEDAKGASGQGRVPWSVLESHGITTKSVLKPSVVVISATRCRHTATSVALTDADRWEKHREAVWQTVGDARGGDVIVPDGDDGALRRIGCIEHEERDEANDRWKKRGAGGRKQRIQWLLDGDQRCRFSKGTTTRRYCLVGAVRRAVGWHDDAWAHREKGAQVVELDEDIGSTSYGHICPTTLGRGSHYVADKRVADAMQDAIELYILDTSVPHLEKTGRKKLIAALKMEDEPLETQLLTDLELTRTLQVGDVVSHGHFKKWRIAIERTCAAKGKEAFWVKHTGGGDRQKKRWNAALRADHSFAEGDRNKDAPTRVGFGDIDHVECYEDTEQPRGWERVGTPASIRLDIDRQDDEHRGSIEQRARALGQDGRCALSRAQKARAMATGELTFGPAGGFANALDVDDAKIARVDLIASIAAGGSENEQNAVSDTGLLTAVELDDCIFEVGDTKAIAAEFPLEEGAVMVADTGRYAGLVMQLHADGEGANYWVDKRVNQWSTRARRRCDGINELELGDDAAHEHASSAGRHLHKTGEGEGTTEGVVSKMIGAPNALHHPEFMTAEMREGISKPVMRERHLEEIRALLAASETACDDTHKFNPSDYDMLNAMRINLKPGKEPPPPEFRKQGHHMLEIIAAQIKEMEDAGWIFRGESVTACPIHCVRKKVAPGEKPKWRITSDFRALNNVIQNHGYPLPEVNETIRAVREQACESHRQDLEHGVENPDIPAGIDPKGHDPGVSYVSVGDLAKAFYHMPIHEDDRYLTAMNVPGLGTWLYAAAPMGIKSTPSNWMAFLSKKLRRHGVLFEPGMYDPKSVLDVDETKMNDGKARPHSYLQVYIDDVIIVTASQETHVRCWEHFIKVLEYERLSMTEPKIELGVKYLRYLGHIISHTEVFSDPKKVEAIREMPAPRTKKDVRCWLGMCNYYRPYICNYGKMAKPLTELTTDRFGRDISEQWDADEKYQAAFDALKEKLCEYPVLRLPDLSKPYVCCSDASDYALGAALCQEVDGKLVVIEYASRTLTPSELNYTASEKECLAIKWAAERWRLYLLAAPVKFRFAVRTDKLDEVGRIPKAVKRSVRRTVATANGGRKTVHGPAGGDHLSDDERARQDPYRDSAPTDVPTTHLSREQQQNVRQQTWREVFDSENVKNGQGAASSVGAEAGADATQDGGTRHQTSDKQMNLPPGAQLINEPTMEFRTDHSALTQIKVKKTINNARLAHWVTTMAEYEYTCEYVPGDSKTLDVPDCLSRLISRPAPPSEADLVRLEAQLRADNVQIAAGTGGALDNQERNELETRTEKKKKELIDWKAKQSESAEWQYANCWTTVYSKLFDRLAPDEVLTVGNLCEDGVYVTEPIMQHSEDELSGANRCELGEYRAYDPEGRGGAAGAADEVCGWNHEDEVPGWQDFSGDVDWQTDVVGHIDSYSGITEAVVSQLDVRRGEVCSGETLCTGFKSSYFDEYSNHACEAIGVSEPQRLAAVNNMVQTVQMARPIDPELLADDAMRPNQGTMWHPPLAMRPDHQRAQCHVALADAYFETITGGSCVDEHADETGVNGVDEEHTAETCVSAVETKCGTILGNWFQTANNATLSEIARCTEVSQHELVRINQDRGIRPFPVPHDTPTTVSGRPRSYCGRVGKFKAETWLRLKEGAVFEDEAATTVGNSESIVLPQVLTQPVIELSEVQKLTRDDYIGADDAKLKALRAASQEADEKWVIAQKSNEPEAETLTFRKAANSARQELEKAGALQQKADGSARTPSYAGMYRRAEGDGTGALPKTAPEFRLRGALLEKRDRAGNEWKIVLPTERAQQAVLHSAHHALEGHASHNAMLREISRRYWWKGMQESCIGFVDHCEHCQRTKSRTQRSFGTMAEVEEPESMGIAYSIDFLTCLAPATAGGFTCLMVIVDRWSRRVFAIPCHATTTAQKAAELFYEEICLHMCRGIPIWLQMDRDPRFTSAWFKEFFRLTGVHLHFTTGYKSQSNGLVESANKQLSVLLRTGSAQQRDWWKRRRAAIMKLNSTKQERLGMSPVEAERGVRPRGVMDFDPSLLHEVNGRTAINPAMTAGKHRDAVKAHLDDLIGVWEDMHEHRDDVQDKMMAEYDKHYRELNGMEKGQLVMVEAKHISVPAKKVKGVMDSEKLQPRWFGPYAIAAWHNGCDVEIERGGRHGLHPRSRVHPVFHISKVKLFKGVSKKAELFGDDGAVEPDQWEVSEIIDHRGQKAVGKTASTLEYFVHWANFNIEDYTWEKEADVVADGDGAGANELVAEYWKRREHLDARAVSMQSRTAENLNDDEMDAVRISYVDNWRLIGKSETYGTSSASVWQERKGATDGRGGAGSTVEAMNERSVQMMDCAESEGGGGAGGTAGEIDKRAVRTMDCAAPAWLRGQQGTASVECEVMDEFQTIGFTENVDAGDDV